ncbi:MAG: Fur family transcriptional regulator [Pseudomonas sp.]
MLAVAPSQLNSRAVKPTEEPDKHLLRELIQTAGLRFSMTRLKVLAAMFTISSVEHGICGTQLHQWLNDAGEPLGLASVRDVLRRLTRAGLVQGLGRDRYCLAPDTRRALAAEASH